MSTLDLQRYMDNLLDDGKASPLADTHRQVDQRVAVVPGRATNAPTNDTQIPEPSPEPAKTEPDVNIQRDMLKQLFEQSKHVPAKHAYEAQTVSKQGESFVTPVQGDQSDLASSHSASDEKLSEQPLPEPPIEPVTPQALAHTAILTPLSERLDKQFQTLIFTIANVNIAIPLIDLGGIHRLKKIEHLIGKPHWYGGMTEIQGQHVNVVDGAKWILADRYNDALAADIESAGGYQYLVTLADSKWGIACSAVQDSKSIEHNAVKWRKPSAKRPWLAGLMKESMCAMLDSQQLISMLDAGLHSNQR